MSKSQVSELAKSLDTKMAEFRNQWMVARRKGERATMMERIAYWSALAEEGKVSAFGPVDDPSGAYGIEIVLVGSLSEAEELQDHDPAIESSYGFSTEIAPMRHLVTPAETYDSPPR